MDYSSVATAEPRSPGLGAAAAPFARIELDRFCEDCGYNLRTLPVYSDSHTGIPIVRCPECGRFQSANDTSTVLRPWLHRVTSVLLVGWMLSVVAVIFHLGLAEGALSYATLDELTVSQGTITQRINNMTIRTSSGRGPLEIDKDYQEYRLFITSILLVSGLTAFASGMFAAVVFPHWCRAAYLGLVLAMPIIAGAIVVLIWKQEAPHLLDWGLKYMSAHAGVQLFGGLAGVIFGRPLARLAILILLPPGVRPRLAYLWLADDKPFPKA